MVWFIKLSGFFVKSGLNIGYLFFKNRLFLFLNQFLRPNFVKKVKLFLVKMNTTNLIKRSVLFFGPFCSEFKLFKNILIPAISNHVLCVYGN